MEGDECKVSEDSVHLDEVNTSFMISSSDSGNGCDLADYNGGGENERNYELESSFVYHSHKFQDKNCIV